MQTKIISADKPHPHHAQYPHTGFWLTTANQACLFEKMPTSLQFTDFPNQHPCIRVDANQTYQTMEGFGFCLTGGSAFLLNNLPALTREALLTELFSTQEGAIGISYLRLCVGASDLSAEAFTYDDMPTGKTDIELLNFNILAGDLDVIPILRQILAINPKISIMASPWSAPAWMKTNCNLIGGNLKPEYHGIYANYLIKYIQAMNGYGIPIHALTPQNEPLNPMNEPSMVMQASEQAEFIKNHLGPALLAANLNTKIFCWDHNCDMPSYPLNILADSQAREFVAGTAWHLYGGEISALSQVHDAYPDKLVYFTEQWVGADGLFEDDLIWHAKNVLIGSIRNWSSVVLEWNLAADPSFRPHTPGGCQNCVGALTIGDAIQRNIAYYLMAHLAKFVRPGSVRIYSDCDCGLLTAAFVTPTNTMALVVLNDSDSAVEFNIQIGGKQALARMEASALGTFVW